MDNEKPITMQDLYPQLTDEERAHVEAKFRRYLEIMVRIAERLHAEGYDLSAADLTQSRPSATIQPERSNSPSHH